MKAYKNGSHFSLYPDYATYEMRDLLFCGKVLEAELQADFSGKNLGKKVTLRYDESSSTTSVDFYPENSDFNGLKRIDVIVCGTDMRTIITGGMRQVTIRCGVFSYAIEEEDNALMV
ncbi:MAG: hypothetical protein ABIA21_02365 [Candidatus Aenigmatarchaeota archaeon]